MKSKQTAIEKLKNFEILRKAFLFDVLGSITDEGEIVYDCCVRIVADTLTQKKPSFNDRKRAELVIDFINTFVPAAVQLDKQSNPVIITLTKEEAQI
jgi:hypothetical protein